MPSINSSSAISSVLYSNSYTSSTGSITIPSSTGSITFNSSTGTINIEDMYNDQKNQVEFFELCLLAMGYDIKYDDFKKMSPADKKSLLRDIKLNRIL